MNERKTVLTSSTGKIDHTRIPQFARLQIGAIFLQAFKRDCETPEFQECYRQWQQEKAAQAARDDEKEA